MNNVVNIVVFVIFVIQINANPIGNKEEPPHSPSIPQIATVNGQINIHNTHSQFTKAKAGNPIKKPLQTDNSQTIPESETRIEKSIQVQTSTNIEKTVGSDTPASKSSPQNDQKPGEAISRVRAGFHQITPKDIDELLASRQNTRRMVDCVLLFDEELCPPQLKDVSEMASGIFRNGGRCIRCSPNEQKLVRRFLIKLQKKRTPEYRRLIKGLNKF